MNVLPFPAARGPNPARASELSLNLRQAPTFQEFNPEGTQRLYENARHTFDASQILLDFLDGNRVLARQAGIESLAVELGTLVEGDHMGRVIDSLEDAASKSRGTKVSLEGLGKIRRAERLLAEANSSITKFTDHGLRVVQAQRNQVNYLADVRKSALELEEQRAALLPADKALGGLEKRRIALLKEAAELDRQEDELRLGQYWEDLDRGPATPRASSDPLLWVPFLAFGVGLVVLILSLGKTSE